ncbi:hypothetical protein L9F63_012907, partial [Diploptera punctata]
HYKLEAAIASMNWRVQWSDVYIMPTEKTRGSVYSLAKRGSQVTMFSEDAMSVADLNRQVFVPTAFYKGTKVAIKKINKSRIELTRPLLLEFKRMRDLHHDHLVRFLGACVEPPHACLLTEYCPKGSLQDILENEQFKLDWMFRYSLMHDIVRGMSYLHNSEVRSHGALKSSNCVVDSRFVLKITDFGLHSLRGGTEDSEDTDSYAYWRKQLWTAPELLRLGSQRPPEGTQKGDVYSFAIIVHEIITRQGPFYLQHLDLSPREINEMSCDMTSQPLVEFTKYCRMLLVGDCSGAKGGGTGGVRRPHCTLNCASCTAVMEERFRHITENPNIPERK